MSLIIYFVVFILIAICILLIIYLINPSLFLGNQVKSNPQQPLVVPGTSPAASQIVPTPQPASQIVPTPQPATQIVPVTQAATSSQPAGASSHIGGVYNGLNGTVTGNTYCAGPWESPDNHNKNLICNDVSDPSKKSYSCNTLINTTPLIVQCSNPDPNKHIVFTGLNGSVSGDTYCAGSWGNPIGTNKNLKCLNVTNYDNTLAIDCNIVQGSGSWKTTCYS